MTGDINETRIIGLRPSPICDSGGGPNSGDSGKMVAIVPAHESSVRKEQSNKKDVAWQKARDRSSFYVDLEKQWDQSSAKYGLKPLKDTVKLMEYYQSDKGQSRTKNSDRIHSMLLSRSEVGERGTDDGLLALVYTGDIGAIREREGGDQDDPPALPIKTDLVTVNRRRIARVFRNNETSAASARVNEDNNQGPGVPFKQAVKAKKSKAIKGGPIERLLTCLRKLKP